MNKRFGVIAILVVLVLVVNFSSANWFSDIWNKISGKGISGNAVTSKDCSAMLGKTKFTGSHNKVGLSNGDDRFFCFNGRFYECGWESSDDKFAYKAKDGYVVGNKQCNLRGGTRWIDYSPTSNANNLVGSDNGDCIKIYGGKTFQGKNGRVGTDTGDFKFYCYNNNFYECGWTLNFPNFATKMDDGNIINDMKCDLSTSSWVPLNPSTPEEIPIYRAFSSEYDDYFYTKDILEITDKDEYTDEGIKFYLYDGYGISGTRPFYRLYSKSQKDHFYTVGVDENNTLNSISAQGYEYEDVLGYMFSSQVLGTVPLYRLYNRDLKNHIYTTSSLESKNLNLSNGYSYENIEGYVFSNCSTICATSNQFRNNNDLKNVYLTSNPSSVHIGTPFLINMTSSSKGNYGYEFQWTYRFTNGDVEDVCSCNFYNESIWSNGVSEGDLKLSSGRLNNKDYSLTVNLTDQKGRIISNISFSVASRNDKTLSDWSEPITINVSNPVCTSPSPCNIIGENTSIMEYNNKYKTCVASSNGCLNWSEEKTCNSGYTFDGTKCSYSPEGINTCEGGFGASSRNPTFCFESDNKPDGTTLESASCGNNYEICVSCNSGLIWDSNLNQCIDAMCKDKCSAIKGFFLNNTIALEKNATGLSAGLFILNDTINDCGNNLGCYVCKEGSHEFNGTCVPDSCGGFIPEGTNFTNGSSTFLTGDFKNWTYNLLSRFENKPLGLCEWYCDEGFRLDTSTNNTCIALEESEKLDCLSEAKGFCYSGTEPINSINLTKDASCEDEGDVCFICEKGYKWNGSSCVEDFSVCGEDRCLNPEDKVCYPLKYRLINSTNSRLYCSNDLKFKLQKGEGMNCSSPYECESNYCNSKGKCFDVVEGLVKQVSLLRQIMCFFTSGFSISNEEYNICIFKE